MEKQLESSETDKSQLSLSLKETKDNLERTRGELTSQQVRELVRERERRREKEGERGREITSKAIERKEERERVCDCERKKDKTTRPRSN